MFIMRIHSGVVEGKCRGMAELVGWESLSSISGLSRSHSAPLFSTPSHDSLAAESGRRARQASQSMQATGVPERFGELLMLCFELWPWIVK